VAHPFNSSALVPVLVAGVALTRPALLSIIDNLCLGCYFCILSINVNLTPELEGLIRQKVSSGRYNSASEVVREALRLMEAEDQLRAAKLAQLRHDVQEGMRSRPARPWNVAEMKREGRKRLAARTATHHK
jgi:antitoxin ParD1/3/4